MLLTTLFSLALAVPPADSLARFMAPGVSRDLARYRAAQVRDVRYALTLDVTGRDTAVGHVTVRFEKRGGGDVILDWRGLALGAARANGRPVAGLRANRAHVRIPAAALRAGANEVDLDFRAAIAPAGASIIRYHDATDGSDYLYTLLVPADANALFPCFDQPDLKARVSLTLVTRAGLAAVANGAERGTAAAGAAGAGSAGERHVFEETQPISTYLIAFAAGPWAKETRAVGGRSVTMYVRASRAKEAETDSLIAANARAVAWLEQYFARPFPFGKFDFVLAPAFPFGGMEHPGAIFYNEDSFIYREPPTLPQRLGREATIYHEVAHQWFGDFVTMKWFDDLWLKEGFATYMAAKMQDAISPASNAWKTFYLRNKPAAYSVDASEGTVSVYQPLANLDQAKSNYGAIVYNKAPSVLKQLNYLVGEDAFQRGVRAFLAAHPYGNATWQELLGAVGTAAGRDLAEFGRHYMLRPGMPVVEQASATGGAGAAIALVQRPARAFSGRAPWPMRLEVLFADDSGRGERVPAALHAERTVVRAPSGAAAPRFVFANAGDYGYAIVLLDTASARYVEQHVGAVRDDFLRAMLWGAMWDMVREARLDPARYVAMAMRELPLERDEQIVPSVLGRAVRAADAYLPPARRDSVLPALERMLATVADDSTRAYGVRKAYLDALIGAAATPAALAALDARLDSTTAAGGPLRLPTRWAIVTALIARGAPTAERRFAEESRRDTTSEGRRRAFVAGAARADAATKAAYFHRYFADSSLNEEWVTASLRAFNHPAHQALTRRFLVPALDTLPWVQQNRRIFFLGSWLGAFLDGQTSEEAKAQVDRWLAAHPRLPADLRQKVQQNADELDRTVRIRRTFGGARVAPGTGRADGH